jgi:tetratricopeptide (TPR) repeat protein
MFHIALLDGRYDDAKVHLQKLIAIRSDDLSLYDDVALLKKVEKLSKKESHDAVEEAINKNEAVYDVSTYEALRLLAEGENGDAETLLKQSLEKNDHSIAALMAMANLKTKEGNDAEAKDYLRKAIDTNEDLFVARYNLANIYIRSNDYSQISELLGPVYEFAPELGETWYNYAVALIRTSKNNEAMQVAEAYVERYKDDATRKDKVTKLQNFVDAAKKNQNPAASALPTPGK